VVVLESTERHTSPMFGALDRIDYFAVANLLPWLPMEPIGAFRRAHYPTAHLIQPHLTVVFPVPATIGRDVFRDHVRDVVSRTPAFDIRLRGLDKTWDHWLFLAAAEGRDEVIELHDALYTGVLLPYLWTQHPYVPHVGLGHFAEEQDTHDPLELRPRAFDRARLTRPGGRPRGCASTTAAVSRASTSSCSTATSPRFRSWRRSLSARDLARANPGNDVTSGS
jgi:2'-5' RNA ligase superfamily protein